jgi:tetratricopeptide (TPR) repeat protein
MEALRLIEDLNASGPVDANLRLALALANKRLGRTLHRLKRYDEAIPYFLKALDMEKAEVQRDPVNVTSRVNLSFTWNDMGGTHAAMNQLPRALTCFQEALKLREELVRGNAKDVRSASLLATTKLRMAQVVAKQGRPAEVLPLLREALQTRERLAAKDPKNAGARGEVAEANAVIGDTLVQLRRDVAARDYYERARAIYTDLDAAGKLSADYKGEPDRLAAVLGR